MMNWRKYGVCERTEAAPVIHMIIGMGNLILRDIGFQDRIDQTVKWDESQCKVTPGHLAAALVLSMFYGMRHGLYKVDEWYANQHEDTRALYGENAGYEQLNDDALGRMLDRIEAAGTDDMFMQLCTQAITKYHIAFDRMHSDTTSISFWGAYLEEEDENGRASNRKKGSLKLIQGYNKDHRPECVQAVVGKIVNEFGIPLAAKTLDGNTSDIEWNRQALDMIEGIRTKGLGGEAMYIADSKLMTKDLFERMMDETRRIPFVCRVPANYDDKLESRTLKAAYASCTWQDLGVLVTGKKACSYAVYTCNGFSHGKPVRLVSVRSSAGEARLEKKLDKHRKALDLEIAAIESKKFACLADAQKEYVRFEKVCKRYPFQTQAQYEMSLQTKRPVGRPNLKEPKPDIFKECYRVKILAEEDAQKVQTLKQQETSFVLITNRLDLNGEEILRRYKGQQTVEIDFRYLKQPNMASPIFLKTPGRIRALVMLMHVALLVNALLQYRLRKGRKAWTNPVPYIGWNGAEMMENPTFYYLTSMTGADVFRRRLHDPTVYDWIQVSADRETITILMEMMEMAPDDIIDALM